MSQLSSGSVYTHTMHIPNLYDYGNGKSLAGDWLNATVGKYSAYYSVPLLTPTWGQLAAFTLDRNAHFAAKDTVTAIYDPAQQSVTVTSPAAATVQLSGVRVGTTSTYGGTPLSTVKLAAGRSQTGGVTLRP